MLSTQIWIVIKQSTKLELNEQSLCGNECEEITHSQQQPQAPKTHKKKPTIRLTTKSHNALCPPKIPSLKALGLSRGQVKDTHSAINKLNSKEAETVNLTENAQSDTFKAPCCCFENAPNTALTIVCTINVSMDCNWFDVPNLPQKTNILK